MLASFVPALSLIGSVGITIPGGCHHHSCTQATRSRRLDLGGASSRGWGRFGWAWTSCAKLIKLITKATPSPARHMYTRVTRHQQVPTHYGRRRLQRPNAVQLRLQVPRRGLPCSRRRLVRRWGHGNNNYNLVCCCMPPASGLSERATQSVSD